MSGPSQHENYTTFGDMTALISENNRLTEEVQYYRRILFSNINPTNSSVINALRHSGDIADENRRLRSGFEMRKLSSLVQALEHENTALRNELARVSRI